MERFRDLMEEHWREFEREASALGDANVATVRGTEWYEALTAQEKRLADRVLGNWVLHGTTGQRFDALAIIRAFRITSTEAALRQLVAALAVSSAPRERDLREKVEQVLDTLQRA